MVPGNVRSLTPAERLDLIEEIWDSLQPEEVPVTDTQRAELDRRSADLDRDIERGSPLGIPWEDVLRRIRERPR